MMLKLTKSEGNKTLFRKESEAKADFQKILELTTDTHIVAEVETRLQELANYDYWPQYSWRTGN